MGLSLHSKTQVPISQGFAWGTQSLWADEAHQEDLEELEMCSLFVHLLVSLSTSAQAEPGNEATPESGPVETGPTGPVATALVNGCVIGKVHYSRALLYSVICRYSV